MNNISPYLPVIIVGAVVLILLGAVIIAGRSDTSSPEYGQAHDLVALPEGAYNQVDEVAACPPVQAPSPPIGLTVVSIRDSVDLFWAMDDSQKCLHDAIKSDPLPVSCGFPHGTLEGYDIYRHLDLEDEGSIIEIRDDVSCGGSYYNDSDVPTGRKVLYQVRTVTQSEKSGWSEAVTWPLDMDARTAYVAAVDDDSLGFVPSSIFKNTITFPTTQPSSLELGFPYCAVGEKFWRYLQPSTSTTAIRKFRVESLVEAVPAWEGGLISGTVITIRGRGYNIWKLPIGYGCRNTSGRQLAVSTDPLGTILGVVDVHSVTVKNGGIDLEWGVVAGAERYEYALEGEIWHLFDEVDLTAPPVVTASVMGLYNHQSYEVQVRAVDIDSTTGVPTAGSPSNPWPVFLDQGPAPFVTTTTTSGTACPAGSGDCRRVAVKEIVSVGASAPTFAQADFTHAFGLTSNHVVLPGCGSGSSMGYYAYSHPLAHGILDPQDGFVIGGMPQQHALRPQSTPPYLEFAGVKHMVMVSRNILECDKFEGEVVRVKP